MCVCSTVCVCISIRETTNRGAVKLKTTAGNTTTAELISNCGQEAPLSFVGHIHVKTTNTDFYHISICCSYERLVIQIHLYFMNVITLLTLLITKQILSGVFIDVKGIWGRICIKLNMQFQFFVIANG